MSQVNYFYRSQNIIIQCEKSEKMKVINERLKGKLSIQNNDVYYLYNGNKVNEELTYNEIANGKNNITIILNDKEGKQNKIIESKAILCPKCDDFCILSFKNYKFHTKCKNGHKKNNILINEFVNLENNIKCSLCSKNRLDTFNFEFYYCLECKISICPLCKSKHKHKIINYDNKFYICNKHNSNYNKYCDKCKLNLCMKCNIEHKGHKIIDLTDLYKDKNELLAKLNLLKSDIDKFNNELNNIINIIKEVKNNMIRFYEIYNKIINNYDDRNINYEILSSLNDFMNNNMFDKLKNYNSILDIFQYINDIYKNMKAANVKFLVYINQKN